MGFSEYKLLRPEIKKHWKILVSCHLGRELQKDQCKEGKKKK